MPSRPSKVGVAFVLVYLVLVAWAAGYILFRIYFKPVNSEFCGLPLLVLTAPWSLWITQLASKLGYNFDFSIFLNIALMLSGAAINGWLVYLFGSVLEPRSSRSS